MVQILLLCGYRQSGKDHFLYTSLIGEQLWSVYSKKGKENEANEVLKPRSRIALLDSIKVNRSQSLGLGESVTINQVDQIKDNIKVGGKILRDYFYEDMTKKMLNDKFVMEKEIFTNLDKDTDYALVDWKLMNTLDYLNTVNLPYITCRVFREDGPCPDVKEKIEHILDKYITDFVLIPKDKEESHFSNLKKMFPQYEEYVKAI